MTSAASEPAVNLHTAASDKLSKVLGPARGQAVLAESLRQLGLPRISTADELFRLGQHLERQGGFIATIGALLCLTAVMHGAAGRRA